MRLTLRTLLAYLDDRLSPANARELGQKVSASRFARELAQRIKAVVRKRRLASDDSNQKVIDANLIAEYLDDQLTPELVALIEKEILGSDHSLAEVAATHQILGALTEPLEVNEKLQKRLYQMDPVAEAEAGGAVTEAEITASKDWQPLAPATPSGRRSPMLVLGLLVLGWLAMLFLDQNLYRPAMNQSTGDAHTGVTHKESDHNDGDPAKDIDAGQNGAQDGDVAAKEPSDGKAPQVQSATDRLIAQAEALGKPLGGNDVVTPQVNPTLGGAENVGDAGDQTASNASGPVNALAGDESHPNLPETKTGSGSTNIAMTDVGEKRADDKRDLNPSGVNPNSVNPNGGNVDLTDLPMPKSPSHPAAGAHSFFVDDPAGAFILSDVLKADLPASPNGQRDWFWAANLKGSSNWSQLLSQRIACVPAPFSATLGSQTAGWQIQSVGASVFQTIDKQHSGLKVFSGQFILTRLVTADPQPFLLEVAGQQLLLNLQDTKQHLAITVSSIAKFDELPRGGDVNLLSASADVLVMFAAFEGDASIQKLGSDDQVTVAAGNQVGFSTDAVFSGKVSKQSVLQWEWVRSVRNPIPAAQINLQTMLIDKLRKHQSVRDAVTTVAEDSNPIIARWAVRIPAAKRDVEQLVRLLFQSEQQVVRSEAFYALQKIARTVPGGRLAIVAPLETRLNVSEMQQAMKLIEEVSRISLEDRATSKWLVDLLGSDRLVLREMAISTLEQHLNNRNNYFADDSKSRRDRAVRRWSSMLDRNDGRLIPAGE